MQIAIPLTFAALLFCVGVYGVLSASQCGARPDERSS